MRDNGAVQNRAVYIAFGIRMDGTKEVLGMWVSSQEGAKFWLKVLTELRNRGVQDIFIGCVDGLKGFPEAIEAVFPKTQVQLCIVHLVRSSLEYACWKQKRAMAGDLRLIYRAPTEEEAERATGAVRGQMGCHASGGFADLGAQLEPGHSVFRISTRYSESDLYDERDQVAEHDAAQGDEDVRLVSQRGGGVEAAVSGADEGLQEMVVGAGMARDFEPLPDPLAGPHAGSGTIAARIFNWRCNGALPTHPRDYRFGPIPAAYYPERTRWAVRPRSRH